MNKRSFRIKLLQHKTTQLLMAVSSDLKGLVVHGLSVKEIESRLPALIKDLLEAEGHQVADIELLQDNEFSIPEFGPPEFVANASFRSAA